MPESFDHHYAMQALAARNLEAQARAMMAATPGLGELQAYRVAQMQRAMRGMNKNTR